MQSKTIFFLFLSFLSFDLFCQEWIFEYDSPDNTMVLASWKNSENGNTIHRVVDGNKRRPRLIELNEFGDLVSFYQTKSDKDVKSIHHYLPHGRDRFISLSYKCTGELVSKKPYDYTPEEERLFRERIPNAPADFNKPRQKCTGEVLNTYEVYNASGNKLLTDVLEKRNSRDYLLSNNQRVSILRQDLKNSEPDAEFQLLKYLPQGKVAETSFSLAELKDKSPQIYIKDKLLLNDGTHLIMFQLFETVSRKPNVLHYPKLAFIKQGKIEWIKSFEGEFSTGVKIIETETGFLLVGITEKSGFCQTLTILNLDKNGNEINRFKPLSGLGTNFYVRGNRLFSVHNKISSSTIYLHEYEISTGNVLWEKEITNDYVKVSRLKIGVQSDNYLIITGTHFGNSMTPVHTTGFVMKTLMNESETSEQGVIPKQLMSTEDLVKETSENVLSVKVSPNPATFKINFEIANEAKSAVRILKIIGVNGQIQSNKRFTGNQTEVDISNFPRGTYFYTIASEDDENVIQGKFIAQ